MKKLGIIFSVIIVVSLMPWAVPTATAGNNNALGNMGDITITLEATQYEITQVDEYSVIDMEGFGSIINPGEPKLPSKTFLVGLPPGAEAVSVDMVASDYAEIPGEYRIMPAPPIVSLQENEKVKWGENEEIYSSENPYPSSPYEYLGMGQMRKYYFARVGFSPIAYYPATGELGLYRSITLKIKYEITQAVPPELLSDTVMDGVASQIIFNYARIKSRYQAAIAPSAVSYNYVIIATDSLQNAVQPLVTWKTAIGYSVNVVTTSWILSNYPGIDLPEQIRNFLIDKYAEWGIEYVLIVGSHSVIPMRYCYPDPSNHTSSTNPDVDGRTPTDYYYADLNGDWDSDGDGYFGEYGQDNVDFHPDVYVGRIPVDNSAMVTSICQKSVNFEQDGGAWKKKALLLGAICNYENEDGEGYPKTDGAALMEECWNDILNGNGYSRERMYEKEGLSPSTYGCEHPLTNSNVLNGSYGWPSGYGIVNWGAHGWTDSAAREVWEWDDGDGVPESPEMTWPAFIQSSDTNSLDASKPAIVFSSSCLTGYPEETNNLGKSLLERGAVAFIGATRYAYGSVGWQNEGDGGCNSIDYYFFDHLINQQQKCGDALYNSKRYYLDNFTGGPWASGGWFHWQNMFDFCLYGEPSLGTEPISPSQPDITVSPHSFDVTLPPDTIQDYTLTIGNNGGATLAYSISEEETTGVGSTPGGQKLLSQPGSMVLEIPLERSPAKPLNTPEAGDDWQNIMTDGFEGTFPGVKWQRFGNPTWDKDDSNPYSGSYSAFCAKGGTAGVNPPSDYPNNMNSWMVYGPFSLEDAADAELNFYCWLDSEYGYDYLMWMASTNGANWDGWMWSGDSGGWVSESFDLTDVHTLGNLCGQSQVWIAFVFQSDYMITDKGAFIDSVVLRQYVAGINNPPNTPSTSSPANHATGVSVDADLSWTGGDPDAGDTVTYDVYFGTSASPPLVSNDQSATSYDPGTLSGNTKYYWKIAATDNHAASTTGPVWYFTTGGAAEDCPWLDEEPKSGTVPPGCPADSITVTFDTTDLGSTYTGNIIISSNDPDESLVTVPVALHVSSGNNPPNTPSNPSPADDATGVSINANLSWTGGDPDVGETVTYDVRLGTSASPPLVSNDQSTTTYDLGTLNNNTKYYWKIVATDNHAASTTGPVWYFTTGVSQAASVSIDPPSRTVSPGGTCDIDVWVDAGDNNLKGIDVAVQYDSHAMTTTGGDVVGHNLLGGLQMGPEVTEAAGVGEVTYALASVDAVAGVDASVMTITFTMDAAAEPGDYALTITRGDLADENAEPVVVLINDGTVTVVIGRKGDFDNDDDIDIFDFVLFAAAYGSELGDENYNPIGDFNNDGEIDIYDFVLFAEVYGT